MQHRPTSRTARAVAVALVLLAGAAAARAEDVVVAEPKSGVKFAIATDGMTLLGTGLRTRTMLNVKVYAIGLYVDDAALKGPLAAFKGRTSERDFAQQLMWGDFRRQVTMKFLRGVTADQIQGAFREVLTKTDPARTGAFVAYFPATKEGEEYTLRWEPGQGLLTTVAGQARPPINDKDFAASVFGIWLGDKPIQEDIKKGLLSRSAQALP